LFVWFDFTLRMHAFEGFHKIRSFFLLLSDPLQFMRITNGPGHERSDEQLIGTYLLKGDLDILGELYSRYMPLVHGVALKYLGNREDARDAVMQIFEKLIHEIRNHEVRNFRSWLYVLSKNHCLMTLRSEKSDREKRKGWEVEQNFMESEEELHPLDREDASLESALEECIGELKNEQKECIRLFYYKKMCYREISEKLGLSETKVKSHLQNGKRNLKICLEGRNVK
jgi:RNA polymerase sigma-70 factor (ECF subfamily)